MLYLINPTMKGKAAVLSFSQFRLQNKNETPISFAFILT